MIKIKYCFIFLTLFTACEEEKVYPEHQIYEDTQPTSLKATSDFNIDQIEFDGEMFVFDSWEEFESAELFLKDQVLAHNKAFGELHTDLDDEAFNQLALNQAFDEFGPLTDFENHFGIQSKRKQINSLVNQWLSEIGDTFNPDTYPDLFPVLGQEARSFINIEGEVKIGDDVVQINDVTPTQSPACFEENFRRDFRTFATPTGGTLVMVHTTSLKIIFNNLLQRAETSASTFAFGSPSRPFKLKTGLEFNVAWLKSCDDWTSALTHSRIMSHTIERFSTISTFAMKPYGFSRDKVLSCGINSKIGHGQFMNLHCL